MAASRILRKLQKRPLLFNSMIYGSFYTGAEFAQQTYNNMFKPPLTTPMPERIKNSDTIDDQTQPSVWLRIFNKALTLSDEDSMTQSGNYNWAQLKRYAIYGCFIAGPMLHGWYKWLDTFCKGKTMKIVLAKLFVDQFVFTPPLIIVFYISMSLMENKADIFNECKAKFVQTFKTSCMYWLPVQFLNFLLIPASLRVTFVSIAAFCWVNILCYVKRAPISECDQNNRINY
ncbi:mpv17-like protein [Nomia melanderi]|uniref:mpv17-like protein n=1 Tax=Nomia melanderi TaxID=2448451 RepID=UPI003FCD9CEA